LWEDEKFQESNLTYGAELKEERGKFPMLAIHTKTVWLNRYKFGMMDWN